MSDLVFTVSGPTEGAILVEWNVAESSQGSGEHISSYFLEHGRVHKLTKIQHDSWDVGLPLPCRGCQRDELETQ